MNTLQKAWYWFVYSSKDPAKMSLTLKAGLPFVVSVLAWHGLPQDTTGPVLDQFITDAVNVTVAVAQVGAALTAFYGAARKVWLTISKQTV